MEGEMEGAMEGDAEGGGRRWKLPSHLLDTKWLALARLSR